jgi:chromosome segregation ATPase
MRQEHESKTPRTDAAIIKTAGGDYVHANDCAEIESERSTLREELQRAKSDRDEKEAGLTELGNELFDCKAQLKDADDRLAALEEELRQAREDRSDWINKCAELDKGLATETGSLRAALVEAQEALALESAARHHAERELEAWRTDTAIEHAEQIESLDTQIHVCNADIFAKGEAIAELRRQLVEAQEIGARKDEALKLANKALNWFFTYFPSHSLAFKTAETALQSIALALTQTPNLYREMADRNTSLGDENARLKELLGKVRQHMERADHSAGQDDAYVARIHIQNALSEKALSAIGRKGGE